MLISAAAFYLFGLIVLISALLVITARNPVHSVLFLILAFFNATGLFVLLGAEFIAFILVIVYVGAVAVLFLFVVMMLDVDFKNLRKGAMQYVPIGLIIGGILLFEFVIMFSAWPDAPQSSFANPVPNANTLSNTEALGQIMYTKYIFPFQVAGLVLFVAMIGAIVLTHRTRSGVRKQRISDQHTRTPDDAMEMKKVTSRSGV